MNLLLSVAKFIFGYLINSRAVLMDAWNGFSDMVSSVLSILSAAYASKRVDREHPLGFGRLEYVTSMFSTVFIKPKDIRELRSHPGHSSRAVTKVREFFFGFGQTKATSPCLCYCLPCSYRRNSRH